MTDVHKRALAMGRDEGRAVRNYLAALEAHKPKRGRKRTADGIQRRLDQISLELPYADPLTRVHLTQEQMDLHAELQAGPEQRISHPSRTSSSRQPRDTRLARESRTQPGERSASTPQYSKEPGSHVPAAKDPEPPSGTSNLFTLEPLQGLRCDAIYEAARTPGLK